MPIQKLKTKGENLKITGKNFYFYEFHDFTFSDLLESVKDRAELEIQNSSTASMKDDASFSGTASLDDSLKLMHNGHPSMIKKLNEASDLNLYSEPRQEVDFDVAGMFPVMPIFIAGDDNCFFNFREEPSGVLNLYIPSNYSCFVNQKFIEEVFGPAVLAVIRILEAQGFMIKLTAVDLSHSGYSAMSSKILIKDSSEYSDLSRISAAFHPSFLRRILFAMRELAPDLPSEFRSNGYGYPADSDFFKDFVSKIDSGKSYAFPMANNFTGMKMQQLIDLFINDLKKQSILNEGAM